MGKRPWANASPKGVTGTGAEASAFTTTSTTISAIAPRVRLGSFGAGAAAGRLGSLRDPTIARLSGTSTLGAGVGASVEGTTAAMSASAARAAMLYSSPSPPPSGVAAAAAGEASVSGVMLSAANLKAAAARARIPSPDPENRREKRKSVSWVGDENLINLRWFKKVFETFYPFMRTYYLAERNFPSGDLA